MNRNRPILGTPVLASLAAAALLGGPRLAEASNDFSRKLAECESKARSSTPVEPGKTDTPAQSPSISAAPDVCVSKPDTDGRWSFALDTCDRATVLRPAPIHSSVDMLAQVEPVVSLHAPNFNAMAPPIPIS